MILRFHYRYIVRMVTQAFPVPWCLRTAYNFGSCHFGLVIKLVHVRLCCCQFASITSGYCMVSEVKQTLKQNGVKRHRLPSDEIGPRQPQRKLAPFQTTRWAHYLLIWDGQKGKDIYNTWTDITVSHVSPQANPVFARFKFHSRIQLQAPSESAEKFVTALCILAQDCDFKDPDEIIRDRIEFRTNSLIKSEKSCYPKGLFLRWTKWWKLPGHMSPLNVTRYSLFAYGATVFNSNFRPLRCIRLPRYFRSWKRNG